MKEKKEPKDLKLQGFFYFIAATRRQGVRFMVTI